VDLHGILKHWEASTTFNPPHIVIAILGRFKGEIGENYRLLPIVTVTSSGIDNKLWIGRRLEECYKLNITNGPLFRSKTGSKIRAIDVEPQFFDRLESIQSLRPDLISPTDNISEEYSFRRCSTSETTNKGLTPDAIEANNRWRKFHKAGASRTTLSMREHYSDIGLTLNQYLRYSSVL